MKATDWMARWNAPDAPSAVWQVRRWLLEGAPRPEGLAQVDGRWDLRGLPLSTVPVSAGFDEALDSIRWESLDLRYATMDAMRLYGVRLSDCLFDHASAQDSRIWGGVVEDCSLRGADLRGSSLTPGEHQGRRTRWENVDFGRAKMRASRMKEADLVRCTFLNASDIRFQNCTFQECSFVGPLRGVNIAFLPDLACGPQSPRRLGVDFREAVFHDSVIRNYDLRDTIFPSQEDFFICQDYVSVLRRGIELVEEVDGERGVQLRGIFEDELKISLKGAGSCFDLRGVDQQMRVIWQDLLARAVRDVS